MQLPLIEIRDNRQKEWFWIDNEFLDRYSRLVGPVATLVYISLSRHTDQGTQSCFPSMQTIAEEMGIKSRKTVAKGIKVLEDFSIISTQKNFGAGGVRQNNTYILTNRRVWKDAIQKEEKKSEPVAESPQEELPKIKDDPIKGKTWLNVEAWSKWEVYRKEIKKKLTTSSVRQQIAFLEKNQADHIEIINTSIMNGWTGLFPLKKNRSSVEVKKVESPQGKYAHLSS